MSVFANHSAGTASHFEYYGLINELITEGVTHARSFLGRQFSSSSSSSSSSTVRLAHPQAIHRTITTPIITVTRSGEPRISLIGLGILLSFIGVSIANYSKQAEEDRQS